MTFDPKTYIGYLNSLDKEDLINKIVNDRIDKLLGTAIDKALSGDLPTKLIPYMGWWWRDIDIARKQATIATDGSYVGFCENNKWGYPQRSLTEAEFDTFIEMLNEVFHAEVYPTDSIDGQRVGVLEKCKVIHDWMQGLKI